jgi:Papain-like cysteine protease AvrRpt2
MNKPPLISVIDRTRIPLEMPVGVTLSPPAAEPRGWKRIAFHMQHQCHSSWCWAAVASSVSAFCDKSSIFTQCIIANLELRREDCCDFHCGDTSVNPNVNVPHTLGSALNRTGCLRAEVPGQATRREVQQEMEAVRPICVRTLWSDNSDHFVVIVGYNPDTDVLAIEDPLYGPTPEISFERFRTNYQVGGGQWKKTYYTKRP